MIQIPYFIIEMGIKKLTKDFILRADLFASPAGLRCRGEAYYESIPCGIFSLILICLLIALFADDVVSLLTKSEIVATSIVFVFCTANVG